MNKIIHTAEDDEARMIPAIFPSTAQAIVVTAASAQSTAFGNTTGLIRVAVSTDCHLSFGANPTATTSGLYMPAGAIEYFAVNPGTKVAFIRTSADGFASVVEAG